MKFELATAQDKILVEGVMLEAAKRIQKTGSEQWKHILAGEESEILYQRIKDNEVFVYKDESEVVGMFYLFEEPSPWDISLWNKPKKSETFYLHRLSLSDKYRGQGLARQLLLDLQIYLEARYETPSIKLDCMAEKMILNDLYLSSNFKYVGQTKGIRGGSFFADYNKYQWKSKKLDSVSEK